MPFSFSASCHHCQPVGAVVVSWNSAGRGFPLPCLEIFIFSPIIWQYFREHRNACCLPDSRAGRWGQALDTASSHEPCPPSPTVSWGTRALHYLSDKYSLWVITLFQLSNDINKLGIQGITRVRTNNWIFYGGWDPAQACLRVMLPLKLAQACN